MVKLPLRNCTLEELKETFTKLIAVSRSRFIYVCLESRYNDNPELYLLREAERFTTFGEIEIDYTGDYCVINRVYKGEEKYDSLDNFLKDLYEHIVAVYQDVIYSEIK